MLTDTQTKYNLLGEHNYAMHPYIFLITNICECRYTFVTKKITVPVLSNVLSPRSMSFRLSNTMSY